MKSLQLSTPLACMLLCVAASLAWLVPPQAAPAQQPAPAVPTKRALLVGIQDYPPLGDDAKDLPGVRLDIKRMRDILIKDYGFDAGNVTVLQDLNATKARIERELEALAYRAGPSDAIVFYYSGHGTQIPDLSGDEDDGWDEALVPAEELPEGLLSEDELNHFLLDDRVYELLSKFETKNLTVIFDSCFSGGADRRREGSPTSLHGFVKELSFEPNFQLRRKADSVRRARGERDETSPDYSFLAASQPWETSACSVDGSHFTSALVSELASERRKSWNQLLGRVRGNVLSINPTQSPSVRGGGTRIPFTLEESAGEGDAAYTRPSVAVALMLGREGVILGGYESLYSEQAGALYDIYPPGEQSFTGRPLGRVRVDGDNDEGQATADIVRGSFSEGARAIPVSIPLPPARAGVTLAALPQSDEARNRSLNAFVNTLYGALRRRPGLEVYAPSQALPRKAAYSVEVSLDGDQYRARIWAGGGGLLQELVATTNAGALATGISRIIAARHTEFIRLVRLYNPSPPFRLDAFVENVEAAPGQDGGSNRISVVSQRPCWINVIAATERGGPRLVASSAKLKPRQPFAFTFARPTEGRVLLKILATERPLNLKAFRQAPAGRKVEELCRVMQRSLTTGGGGTAFLSTAKWADETLWLAAQTR